MRLICTVMSLRQIYTVKRFIMDMKLSMRSNKCANEGVIVNDNNAQA